MKHNEVVQIRGSSTVAWFKLAQVIARGEKERALSMYRLLIHSLQKEAIKAQLEGDILRMFCDHSAVSSYRRAALLFCQNNEIIQAVWAYEAMITFLVSQGNFEQAFLELKNFSVSAFQKMGCYEVLLWALLSSNKGNRNSIDQCVSIIIESYTHEGPPHKLSRFMAKLATCDEQIHEYALTLLKGG